MKTRYMRISALPDGESSGYPIHFDAPLSEEGKVVGDMPIFGFQGSLNSTRQASFPFILSSDSFDNVDFGEETVGGRYYTTDLREKVLKSGALFTWNGENRKDDYRIDSVLDLAENPAV